jgi:hypothetical protein
LKAMSDCLEVSISDLLADSDGIHLPLTVFQPEGRIQAAFTVSSDAFRP